LNVYIELRGRRDRIWSSAYNLEHKLGSLFVHVYTFIHCLELTRIHYCSKEICINFLYICKTNKLYYIIILLTNMAEIGSNLHMMIEQFSLRKYVWLFYQTTCQYTNKICIVMLHQTKRKNTILFCDIFKMSILYQLRCWLPPLIR